MSDIFSGLFGGRRGGGLAGGLPGGVKAAAVALLIHQLMKQARNERAAAPGEEAGGGGLGGLLGGLFGGTGAPAGGTRDGMAGAGLGGLLGGLGGLLGGLRSQGLERQVESWVAPGPNQPVSPQEIERSFDPGELDEAARRAGTDRGTLLDELSRTLPDFVDRMTPQGQVPQREEDLGAGGIGGLLGGLLGGAFGGMPDAGQTARGGQGALHGGAGGDAARHPGMGGSMEDSPPRVGPAPRPEDDLQFPLGDPGRPHGPRRS
jgi:uncharacterized protein YidB (DUF937 family)